MSPCSETHYFDNLMDLCQNDENRFFQPLTKSIKSITMLIKIVLIYQAWNVISILCNNKYVDINWSPLELGEKLQKSRNFPFWNAEKVSLKSS